MEGVYQKETYKLRVALASANVAELQVRVNETEGEGGVIFTSGEIAIGKDNAIARHGIHGLYHLFNVDVPGDILVEGENTIFLTQPLCDGPFQGFMYDYLRFEAPPSPSNA